MLRLMANACPQRRALCPKDKSMNPNNVVPPIAYVAHQEIGNHFCNYTLEDNDTCAASVPRASRCSYTSDTMQDLQSHAHYMGCVGSPSPASSPTWRVLATGSMPLSRRGRVPSCTVHGYCCIAEGCWHVEEDRRETTLRADPGHQASCLVSNKGEGREKVALRLSPKHRRIHSIHQSVERKATSRHSSQVHRKLIEDHANVETAYRLEGLGSRTHEGLSAC